MAKRFVRVRQIRLVSFVQRWSSEFPDLPQVFAGFRQMLGVFCFGTIFFLVMSLKKKKNATFDQISVLRLVGDSFPKVFKVCWLIKLVLWDGSGLFPRKTLLMEIFFYSVLYFYHVCRLVMHLSPFLELSRFVMTKMTVDLVIQRF